MEFRIEHIAGKTCRIWTCGHDGSVIYWGTARRDDNEETAVAELLKEMTKGKSWTLVAYEVEHWNQDFSPWQFHPYLDRKSSQAARRKRWIG